MYQRVGFLVGLVDVAYLFHWELLIVGFGFGLL
jgi:hypothetical protein